MEYLKKEFPTYNLHMIKTDKFKTTYVEVVFGNKIVKEDITKINFLSSLLTYSTKNYNRKIKYTKKLEDLYAAYLYANTYRLGNVFNVDFNLRVLNDRYGEQGLFEQAIEFLNEVINNPNVKDDLFDSDSFNVVKNEGKSQIERIKEDQKALSRIRMLELYDEDSPLSYNLKGYIKDFNEITRSNLYQFYQKFIKDSFVDVFVIGNIDFKEVEKIINKKLKFETKNKFVDKISLDYKKHRKNPLEKYEKNGTNQARLVIGCPIEDMTQYEKNYVLNIYNIILGGSADSKFFKNIREKFSLCYYIASGANKLDNLLTIASGINKDNYSKMLILIDKEMKDMKKGKFTDEDIDKAKKYCLSIFEEIEDNPHQMIASYYAIDKFGSDSLEVRKEKIQNVTKEEIVKLAKKVYIDTIYMLGGDKK